MAANGIQGPKTIQILEDDNLSRIFQYLTVPKDWYRAARVCTKWRDMILNQPHVQDQIAFQPLKRLAGNVMQISPPLQAPPDAFGSVFGAVLEFSPLIHSKLIGVVGCSKRSKEIRLHQMTAGLPLKHEFHEQLLAITKTVLFFASQNSEKNIGKLILRNPATLEEITSLPLVEESAAVSEVSNEILGCFPIGEEEFITIVESGAIAKWKFGYDTVYLQQSLQIFKKGSPSSYKITDAHHVQDFIFLNFSGEIDSTIAPLQVTRFRKENVLIALDIKKFKIVEPAQVGKLISATSTFLYTCELKQMKGIAVSQTKSEDKKTEEQAAFTLTSQWQIQEDPFAKINERWFVTWKGEKDFYQVDICNAKNGNGFFSFEIEYHSVKLGELSQLCLRGDILALQCGRFIFLWHIPTKKRFLSFKINDLDGYDKRLNIELQDVQLYPEGLLLLFLCSRKHSSDFDLDSDEEVDSQEPIDDNSSFEFSYRIANIPYLNPASPLQGENPLASTDEAPAVPPQIVVPPQAIAQPAAAHGRYAWLWPSYWWGILMSVFRYLLRLFH